MLEILLDFAGECFLKLSNNEKRSAKTRVYTGVLAGLLMAAGVVYGVWDGFQNGISWQSYVLLFAGGLCAVALIHRIMVYRRKKEREPKK